MKWSDSREGEPLHADNNKGGKALPAVQYGKIDRLVSGSAQWYAKRLPHHFFVI